MLNSIRDGGKERMTVIKVLHAVLLQRIFRYILWMFAHDYGRRCSRLCPTVKAFL